MPETKQECPRCRADMQVRFRRNGRTHEWEWVWTCPDCRTDLLVPEAVVAVMDYV